MSDTDNSSKTEIAIPAKVETAQVVRSQDRITQIQENISNLLQNASTFPVRYQIAPELLTSNSGRMALSIVRVRFEKSWDVKEISAKLSEDNARSVYWLINPKRALEPVKVKKDEDEDDFNLDDILKPMKF